MIVHNANKTSNSNLSAKLQPRHQVVNDLWPMVERSLQEQDASDYLEEPDRSINYSYWLGVYNTLHFVLGYKNDIGGR